MFKNRLICLVGVIPLLISTVFPVQPVLAAGYQPPTPPACIIKNFTFPELSLGGDNTDTKFVEIVFTADEHCQMVETSRRVLGYIPQDALEDKSEFSKSVTAPAITSQGQDIVEMVVATTNTAHVKIYQLDCCGIHTITLQTDHAWSWTSTTASLSGNGSTTASWCCYWWHLSAGPTMSHGTYSSSHVYAQGSASYVCYNSQPSPFCVGSTRKYPMTFYT